MACPICQKLTEVAFRPFCSKRCADIDLAKWFSGSYAIPIELPIIMRIADVEHLILIALQNKKDAF